METRFGPIVETLKKNDFRCELLGIRDDTLSATKGDGYRYLLRWGADNSLAINLTAKLPAYMDRDQEAAQALGVLKKMYPRYDFEVNKTLGLIDCQLSDSIQPNPEEVWEEMQKLSGLLRLVCSTVEELEIRRKVQDEENKALFTDRMKGYSELFSGK